jgi:hypothetical protein
MDRMIVTDDTKSSLLYGRSYTGGGVRSYSSIVAAGDDLRVKRMIRDVRYNICRATQPTHRTGRPPEARQRHEQHPMCTTQATHSSMPADDWTNLSMMLPFLISKMYARLSSDPLAR